MNWEELLKFDAEHIWHPYTSVIEPMTVFPVESANGVRLKLADGRELIDGMASWWSVIHGYNHPVINNALKDQIDKVSHVMFGGLTNEPAINLCRKLVEITPEPLQKVFLADSGSVSVEVAMKMAVQYWAVKGRGEKNRFLTVRNGYHGDTFNAMSVCDPVNGMHSLFKGFLKEHLFADAPQTGFYEDWDESDILSFKELIEKNNKEIAAVILEPIVQGAGGMRMYHPEYLRQVRSLCDEHDVLLIFDEIATGFGRTGKLFACEHAGVSPDIMCLGKAITGGYMTLAATLATDKVGEGVCLNEPGVFMHGPTFMGNPLACAAANASLDILSSGEWKYQVGNMECWLNEFLSPCKELKTVQEVRVLGSIGVVELKNPVDMRTVQPAIVEKGVWIRPFGKLIYIMPPYIIENDEIVKLAETIFDIAES